MASGVRRAASGYINVVAIAAVAAVACLCLCASAMAAGDVNQPECSPGTETSPGFRSYLPDCRAYEMVTPPYGAGASPPDWPEGYPPPISADGDHVLAADPGGFAGTENLELFPTSYHGAIYEFSRTSAGWSAESLEPPAFEYPRRQFFSVSADFSRSLWGLEVPSTSGEEHVFPFGNNETLAIREAAGGGKGRFTPLGPVVAPGHEPVEREDHISDFFSVVGASSDLSHVLLSVTATAKQLWPGDATLEGGGSLYEYRGSGGSEPVLVGVKNDGPLEGTPSLNDGAELVSRCGTGFKDISADGEVVYFTADACHVEPGEPVVNELYARVDGSRTVAISEPSLSVPGRECTGECEADERNPEDRSEGVFEGASEDGSKVFFTTSQPLVNGDEDDAPDLYEAEIHDGAVSRLVQVSHDPEKGHAAEVVGVAALPWDGSRVYYEARGVLTTKPNENGEAATEGAVNLYVYNTETDETSFVATGEEAGPFNATRDGQYLLFESGRHLTGSEDTSKVSQLFEYDAQTETLVRVSVGQRSPDGYECEATKRIEEAFNCNGNTTNPEDVPVMVPQVDGFHGGEGPPSDATSALSVSSGGVAVFTSRDALTRYAVAGGENIYEYRAGEVELVAPPDEAPALFEREQSRLLGIDESGENVFFTSADRLVPQDTDTQLNWYDAREGGGFPAPAAQSACAGSTCQGPLGAAPQLPPSAGSEVTAGGGNLPPPALAPVPRPTQASRAQKLAKTLKACEKERKSERAACARRARARYGPPRPPAKTKKKGGKR
jgi:hypothetical protein